MAEVSDFGLLQKIAAFLTKELTEFFSQRKGDYTETHTNHKNRK
jgi:hypothetical protein